MQCAWCGLAGRWWCGGSIIYTALHQYELCPVPLKWPPGPGTSCSQHTGPAAATLGYMTFNSSVENKYSHLVCTFLFM